VEAREEIKGILDMDEKIVYKTMQNEVNFNNIHNNGEKEMMEFFHIKIEIKKNGVYTLLNSRTLSNLIEKDLIT
jgi:hypothetical protein